MICKHITTFIVFGDLSRSEEFFLVLPWNAINIFQFSS